MRTHLRLVGYGVLLFLTLFLVSTAFMACTNLDKAARATTQASSATTQAASVATSFGVPWASLIGYIAGVAGTIASTYLKIRNISLKAAVAEVVIGTQSLLEKTPAPIAETWKKEQTETQSPATAAIVAQVKAT